MTYTYTAGSEVTCIESLCYCIKFKMINHTRFHQLAMYRESHFSSSYHLKYTQHECDQPVSSFICQTVCVSDCPLLLHNKLLDGLDHLIKAIYELEFYCNFAILNYKYIRTELVSYKKSSVLIIGKLKIISFFRPYLSMNVFYDKFLYNKIKANKLLCLTNIFQF